LIHHIYMALKLMTVLQFLKGGKKVFHSGKYDTSPFLRQTLKHKAKAVTRKFWDCKMKVWIKIENIYFSVWFQKSETHCLVLDGGVWWTLYFLCFIPRDRYSSTNYVGGWVDLRTNLDMAAKIKIQALLEITPWSSRS
jgi:hypothetical protein